MKFGKSLLGNYDFGTNREYIVTNGLGSFSSGAINGNLSRRYHGLLISSLNPPLDRYLSFHKIEEEIEGIDISTSKIEIGEEKIKKGYLYLDEFVATPFPKFVYSVNGNILEKEIFMVQGENTVIVKYKLIASVKEEINIKLNLFCNNRDFHKMSELEDDTKYFIKKESKYIKASLGEEPLYIYSNKINDFNEEQKVITNIVYDIEMQERGDIVKDNSFQIGYINTKIKKGETIYIVGSLEELNTIDVEKIRESELNRINKLKDMVSKKDEFLRDLAVAGNDCIVYRKGTGGKTILAGYPWFGDWGRDTMIALPGLTLSTGRFEDAKSILETFAKYCDKGMLPNKFPDWDGEKLFYNTIDASLWFFYAVDKYLDYTKDYEFIEKKIYPKLKEIIKFHINGTRYNIKIDEDGLIYGGDKNTQLTWMDVSYQGWAVTPRYGKAVEINALWYNALKVIEKLNIKFKDKNDYSKYIEKIEKNYEKIFWNEKENCLYDYIADGEIYDDIRPNQIFAVSLPYSLLSEEKSKKVVDKVFEKLYTPHGLKSVSSESDKYIGIYSGTLFERDSSYHQGTVWSWPLGHFITAYKKVYKKADINYFIDGLKSHFYQEGCCNNISEIFDGDSPYTARGCFAQAWSVGELIRVVVENE